MASGQGPVAIMLVNMLSWFRVPALGNIQYHKCLLQSVGRICLGKVLARHPFFKWLDTGNNPLLRLTYPQGKLLVTPITEGVGQQPGPVWTLRWNLWWKTWALLSNLHHPVLAWLVLRHCIIGAFDQKPNVNCMNYFNILVCKKKKNIILWLCQYRKLYS